MTTDNSWATSPGVRASMQGNRSRDTKPELAIRTALHRKGYRYQVSARPIKDMRRTADLVFRKARVAIFVDGCFWHACPDHFQMPRTNTDYWSSKIGRNQLRDQEVDQNLTTQGWKVVRIWEHESIETAVARIERTLSTQR